MTEGILSLIDNAIEDYGEGPDAMRWRPEAPERDRSASTEWVEHLRHIHVVLRANVEQFRLAFTEMCQQLAAAAQALQPLLDAKQERPERTRKHHANPGPYPVRSKLYPRRRRR